MKYPKVMEETIDLRKKVLAYINSADDKLLRMIEALAETYQSEDELTIAQKNELDNRLERYARGETQFFTWEEVEAKLNQIK